MEDKRIPITSLSEGDEAVISSIEAGVKASQRLMEMGLTPGTRVRVNRSSRFGPVEVCVRGSRLVIGHGIAAKVYIEDTQKRGT